MAAPYVQAQDFSTFHWALYGGFALLMAYAEGYKGFQKKFSPMVVQRALTLDQVRFDCVSGSRQRQRQRWS